MKVFLCWPLTRMEKIGLMGILDLRLLTRVEKSDLMLSLKLKLSNGYLEWLKTDCRLLDIIGFSFAFYRVIKLILSFLIDYVGLLKPLIIDLFVYQWPIQAYQLDCSAALFTISRAIDLSYFHTPIFVISIPLIKSLYCKWELPYLRKNRNSQIDVVTGIKELSTEKNNISEIKYFQGIELHDFNLQFTMIWIKMPNMNRY